MWELVGRIAVVVGCAGLLGTVGRAAGIWLKNRRRDHD
jgi:hypothetical protein